MVVPDFEVLNRESSAKKISLKFEFVGDERDRLPKKCNLKMLFFWTKKKPPNTLKHPISIENKAF